MPDENANSGALVPVRTSPRPWRLEYDGATNRLEIRAEDDSLVAAWPMFSPYSDPQPDARLIVESVNGRDSMFDLLKMRREETIRKRDLLRSAVHMLESAVQLSPFDVDLRNLIADLRTELDCDGGGAS